MVDVVHVGLAVNPADEILDNLDDVLLGEHPHGVGGVKTELGVDAETAHIAQIIAFLTEKEVDNHLACAGIVGRLGVSELAVDVVDGFALAVTGVFLQRVEYNLVVA